MRFIRGALAMLAVALTVSGAFAQGTGGLNVKVVDGNGDPLPGATVTISHETGNVKPYTALSNAKGFAQFPVLRPGPGYVLEVSFPGFGTRRETGVRVPIGETTTLPIQLAEEIQERVRVVASSDVVELEETASTTKFSDEFVQDLPVPGRFYQNVLTLAPGVNDADGDGNPTVHGSRSRDFRAEVGGVSNVDPLTGQFMSLVNSDSIEEMEVVTAGAGVEFGRAQGGFARIIQKQGTNEFEGTFSFLFRSSVLDGTGAADRNNLPDPQFEELHPALQLSGPIVKDKLWYRLSWETLNSETPVNVVGGVEVQTREQQIQAYQLTWQVSPRNKLAVQYQQDPLTLDNVGISSTTPSSATQLLDSATDTLSVTWTAPYSPKLLIESTAAYQDLANLLAPSSPGTRNTCVEGDPFLENAQCTNFETGEVSGSNPVTLQTNSQRFTLRSQATLYGGQIAGANHQFKFGFVAENERYFRTLERAPSVAFFILDATDEQNSESTPEELIILSTTVAVPQESRTRATSTNWGVYFEDQIKPTNNFVITVGARVDREEINSDGYHPLDPEAEGSAYLDQLENSNLPGDSLFRQAFTSYEGIGDFVTELVRATGQPEQSVLTALSPITLQSAFWSKQRFPENVNIENTNVSPFLSLSWDPWSNGKNKFAASYRRYYDKIFLAIPVSELNPATTNLVFDGLRRGDGVIEPAGLRSRLNPVPNVELVDRNLKTPYQDEVRFLYERELFTETMLRVEYLNRKYRDQFQNIDLNHVPGDFGRCRFADIQNPGGIAASPGSGQTLTDPHTGEQYIDTDPGDGDGVIDNCIGKLEVLPNDPDQPLPRPDEVPDLYIQNPGWGNVNLIGNFNEADYEAIVLELIRRQYRSWEMQMSYTYSRAEGNGEDFQQFIGLDRSLLDNEFGFQSNDQRHVVKFIGTTITPWGFRLGGTITWASGLPFSVLQSRFAFDAVPLPYGLNTFTPARQRLSYPTGVRNSERNDNQWLVDMKFTKELNLGRGLNMQLSAEVFNLLNDNTYQIYNPDLETGFQLNGVNNARREFGRRWQLGIKMAF